MEYTNYNNGVDQGRKRKIVVLTVLTVVFVLLMGIVILVVAVNSSKRAARTNIDSGMRHGLSLNNGSNSEQKSEKATAEKKATEKKIAEEKAATEKKIAEEKAATEASKAQEALPAETQPADTPSTGPAEVFSGAIGAGAIVTASGYYLKSRKKLLQA